MTDNPHRVALDALLLEAKLSVPPSRSGNVSRAGLIEKAQTSGTGGGVFARSSPRARRWVRPVQGRSSLAELRVLPYLQTHLTIREIAERLFVSCNTVYSGVSSIYRKLGDSSRNGAVQQATTIGLLGA